MAESLVENKTFNAGNGWMKVPYKMETDSLGGSHPEDCQGKHPAPTSLTAQPPALPSILVFGPRNGICAPTTNGMTELAHFSPGTHQLDQIIYSELGNILPTLTFLY